MDDEGLDHRLRGVCSQLSSSSSLYAIAQIDDADCLSSIFLMAFVTSLDGQTVLPLSVYATSSFSKHSLIAVVYTIQGIVYGTESPSEDDMLPLN
jgi:hypothetical protein